MNSRNAVIRRVAFWAALLAGAALVGSQFGCVRSQTTPSTAGFPHAGRWPLQEGDALTRGTTAEADPINWWCQLGNSKKRITQAQVRKGDLARNPAKGTLEPISKASEPAEGLELISAVNLLVRNHPTP